MSYELDCGGHAVSFLGTTSDWGDFLAWVGTLPDADYPDLIHLANFGEAAGADVIRAQVRHAYGTVPPEAPGVGLTARHLFELLAGVDPEVTVRVIN